MSSLRRPSRLPSVQHNTPREHELERRGAPVTPKRPFLLLNDYGKLKKQVIYARQGSSTASVSLDEATRMAAADASEDWLQGELEEQRREREEQRRLQRELHEQIHRPNVVCDFPVIHTVLYLRIKNYGNLPAKDLRITLAD